MYSIRSLIITLTILSFFGCAKDLNIFIHQEVKRVVEGTVFKDCIGNCSKGTKIYLYYYATGCFGRNTISVDSTVTDDKGHFIIHYIEYKHETSTTSYSHTLTIPNSTISLYNPNGHYDLYPNETKMNAVIHLKFHNRYKSTDTFYYKFSPTYDGIVHEPQLTSFFVGPFHDTTLVLYDLTVGNVNNNDNGKSHSGFFKWGIGIRRLRNYYTGHDGYFDLTHKPCAQADTFEYYADPI
jgi:hypothetical protein